jgi:hypothetical protein
MAYRSGFGDILEPGFREIFNDKYLELPQVFPQLFHVNTSIKQDEKDSAISGFGLMVQTNEGASVTYEDPVQMYDKRYTHLKYTLGFKISEELYDDDQYNVMNKKPAALGKAARRTAESSAAGVFNNAFSTSYLGGDAKPLASISHPRSDGGTAQSNASATGITLNETNLETARLAMRAQLDDKGMKIESVANILLVPPALEKDAHVIVDSSLRSDSADNDLNFYKGKYNIIVWDWLTSSTAWFLLDSRQHELTWFWRKKPEFKQDGAFDTGMALYKCQCRFSNGWSDWRGTWGSQGDGANYGS